MSIRTEIESHHLRDLVRSGDMPAFALAWFDADPPVHTQALLDRMDAFVDGYYQGLAVRHGHHLRDLNAPEVSPLGGIVAELDGAPFLPIRRLHGRWDTAEGTPNWDIHGARIEYRRLIGQFPRYLIIPPGANDEEILRAPSFRESHRMKTGEDLARLPALPASTRGLILVRAANAPDVGLGHIQAPGWPG